MNNKVIIIIIININESSKKNLYGHKLRFTYLNLPHNYTVSCSKQQVAKLGFLSAKILENEMSQSVICYLSE